MSTPALGAPLIVVALLLAPPAPVVAASGEAATALRPGSERNDRKTWRALLRWPASCERATVHIKPPFPSGLQLVQVSCNAGARPAGAQLQLEYRGTFLLYLVDRDRHVTGPLVLPVYLEASNLLMLPGVSRHRQRLDRPKLVRQAKLQGSLFINPAAGTLSIFVGEQALGNCGYYYTFRLSGKRFVPVEAGAKLACDGKRPLDFRQWPKLPLP